MCASCLIGVDPQTKPNLRVYTAKTRTDTARAVAFAETQWSIVLQARQPLAHDALEALCRTYWGPLYGYVRRCGHDPATAQDLTQEFFARLLRRNSLERVDKTKGRFRSFLLASLKHFLANERVKSGAIKRQPENGLVSLDEMEERVGNALVDTESPDQLFDRTWAVTLVENSLGQLKHEYEQAGKSGLFDVLQSYLSGERTNEGYMDVAQRMSMSEASVKMAVLRLRRRFGQILRAHVVQTVGETADLDDELRYLFAALCR